MKPSFKAWRSAVILILVAMFIIPSASAHQVVPQAGSVRKRLPTRSGIYDLRDSALASGSTRVGIATALAGGAGTYFTDCPQAGLPDEDRPQPLDVRVRDQVEDKSDGDNDRRANQDFSCFPQNETSIAVNPRVPRNVVGGANDYRLGWGTSGVYASTDEGKTWYDGIIPFPTLPNGDTLDGGGDPAIAFDRDGVVYYADINFNRTDDTNGVFVSRSTNGGFTWSRPCVPLNPTDSDPVDDQAVCGDVGDPRQPGDGVIVFQQDDGNDEPGNEGVHTTIGTPEEEQAAVPFNDKEYIAVGPRPEGVSPECFGPETREPVPCNPAVIGVDRIYVTWTLFNTFTSVETANFRIFLSYSDDQARSWSPPQAISGSAAFCTGAADASTECSFDQGSVPTVNPITGAVYVAFENFNTPDENQYVVVRSVDGGQTFAGPFFVSPVFDRNYPRAGSDPNEDPGNRPDCNDRGQVGRDVLTNSCFRVNPWGNIVVDKRGGNYADDLYLVFSDNRNGSPASSNVDVFLFKSTDGGSTWVGPTRVNDDRSQLTGDRNDPQNAGSFGNDQWFPWVDINEQGHLNVVFHDRRLDTSSTESEWPESRQRPGNYLAWFWGAQCQVQRADSRECVADEAEVIPQPTSPINPDVDYRFGHDQQDFPLNNFGISDVPSNLDYSFRAGLFMGDYNNVAVLRNNAYAFWTDARNGRSSRAQSGRNPACEQADVFVENYDSNSDADGINEAEPTDRLFLVTPCPSAQP